MQKASRDLSICLNWLPCLHNFSDSPSAFFKRFLTLHDTDSRLILCLIKDSEDSVFYIYFLTDSRTASACPVAFTLRQTFWMIPFSSIRNVARSMPMYLRPY